MKKLIIGIGSLLILVFVIALYANAAEVTKDKKKSKAEAKKVEVGAPCQAKCDPASCCKMVNCDPAKCKEMGCTMKNGKCDPATCPMHKAGGVMEGHSCIDGTPCPANCCKKK